MSFTLIEDPQFYGLEMSLNNILMIGLFRSNYRMVIFSKTEKNSTNISGQIPRGYIPRRFILGNIFGKPKEKIKSQY